MALRIYVHHWQQVKFPSDGARGWQGAKYRHRHILGHAQIEAMV